MDVFQFIGYLRQFNADIAVIGAAAWGIDLLLRRTLLKKAKGKLPALLPFLIGAALYAAYAAATGGFSSGTDAAAVFTEGSTCGSIATVIRMLAEGKGTQGARAACVQALLSPYGELPEGEAEKIADCVGKDADEAKRLIAEVTGEEMAERFYGALEKALAGL